MAARKVTARRSGSALATGRRFIVLLTGVFAMPIQGEEPIAEPPGPHVSQAMLVCFDFGPTGADRPSGAVMSTFRIRDDGTYSTPRSGRVVLTGLDAFDVDAVVARNKDAQSRFCEPYRVDYTVVRDAGPVLGYRGQVSRAERMR